jgi:hypothetical protein
MEVGEMRIIFTVFVFLLMGLPFVVKAAPDFRFADASSSIFRFQYKLAEQGNPEAQYKVGEMYELGRGVVADKERAREWFDKAAKQGHQKSSYRLLYLDIEKNGMNPQRKQQLDQLRREAKSGVADAQYFVGRMYANGVGVQRNLNEAQSWMSKATFNGVPEAESELVIIEDEIARIEVREKQQQAAAEAERKKKEAEEKARKEEEARKARERELAARREAQRKEEARKAAAERRQLQDDKAAAAAESRRRAEAERKRQAAAAAAAQKQAAEEESSVPEVDENAVFESDPCKGKKAKFLSICK